MHIGALGPDGQQPPLFSADQWRTDVFLTCSTGRLRVLAWRRLGRLGGSPAFKDQHTGSLEEGPP
jgi:hypothetical protein